MGYFCMLWQEPDIGQFWQPQPHEFLPFFLFLSKCVMISATTTISARIMRMFAMFSAKKVSIVQKLLFKIL